MSRMPSIPLSVVSVKLTASSSAIIAFSASADCTPVPRNASAAPASATGSISRPIEALSPPSAARLTLIDTVSARSTPETSTELNPCGPVSIVRPSATPSESAEVSRTIPDWATAWFPARSVTTAVTRSGPSTRFSALADVTIHWPSCWPGSARTEAVEFDWLSVNTTDTAAASRSTPSSTN